MNNKQTHIPKGYFLLPSSQVPGYRGINRGPFEPLLLGEDVEQEQFLPKQEWRRKAYEIFRMNLVDVGDEDIYILSNIQAAIEIRALIEPQMGRHEIVFGEIWELNKINHILENNASDSMGYDVAYPGGDYYSTILNGLFGGQVDESIIEYKNSLNEFGLFDSSNVIPSYLQKFRRLHKSEQNSTFAIFRLFSLES